MNDFARSAKTAWFGVKHHRNMLIAMLIFCVLIFPAFTLISVRGQADNYDSYLYPMVMSIYGIMVSFAAGLAMPVSFFSYLYNRSACDFYNAMPIRRSQYFWGYFAASALMFAVPWALTALIHCFISEWGNNLWKPFLLSLGLFFVLYCSMTFAVTFSGSKLCAVLTFVIMNILPVMVVMFPITAAGADAVAYGQRIADSVMALTPVSAAAWFTDENPFSNIIPVQLGFGVIELVVSFFMFKYRKSESTMALAFPKTRYFYQYGVMLLTAMFIDAMFVSQCFRYQVYFENGGLRAYNYTNFGNGFWSSTIFFTLVFVLIAFIITNMVLEKTPRAAFKKIRHYFFFVGGYGIFLIITVSLAVNLLPQSILPFTPKYAAVYVYGYEEISENEYDDMYRNGLGYYAASITLEKGDNTVKYTDDFGNEWSDYEREERYYKKTVREAFIVTDKAKLKELQKMMGSELENEYPDIVIFPADRGYCTLTNYGATVYSESELPSEDYTEFKIAFSKDGKTFDGDVEESDLDNRITNDSFHPSNNIFVKTNISVRLGYASDPSLITGYKDYGITLSPGREIRSAMTVDTAAVELAA